jgi:hypothetical protein
VLIITGLPNDPELVNRPSGVPMLAKPFRRAEFMSAIQALLTGDVSIKAP